MSDKLKIAFFTDSFLPAHDGVVTSILNFRKELMKRGHEVYIFTSGSMQMKKELEKQKGVYVMIGMKFKKYPQYNLAILPFNSVIKVSQLDPDIIHAHTPFIMGTSGLAIGKLRKIPVVGTFHTMFTDKYVIQEYASRFAAGIISKYSWKYAKLYYENCNAIMAPSDSIKNVLEKRKLRNVHVVPNSVDTHKFNTKVNGKKLRGSLQRNKNDKIVLYLGRMSKEKRIETLLKAAHMLKNENIRFVIAGTGPAAHYYAKMANRLKLSNVKFVGFVEDEMLPQYYAACDLFCIPSTFETQGIVCLEAMATGKPVVGADHLALHDIIKNGKNGEKFRPGDSKDCANKIKKAINNIQSYKETVKTAEQYSVEKTTDQLLSVYRQVINEMTI